MLCSFLNLNFSRTLCNHLGSACKKTLLCLKCWKVCWNDVYNIFGLIFHHTCLWQVPVELETAWLLPLTYLSRLIDAWLYTILYRCLISIYHDLTQEQKRKAAVQVRVAKRGGLVMFGVCLILTASDHWNAAEVVLVNVLNLTPTY